MYVCLRLCGWTTLKLSFCFLPSIVFSLLPRLSERVFLLRLGSNLDEMLHFITHARTHTHRTDRKIYSIVGAKLDGCEKREKLSFCWGKSHMFIRKTADVESTRFWHLLNKTNISQRSGKTNLNKNRCVYACQKREKERGREKTCTVR